MPARSCVGVDGVVVAADVAVPVVAGGGSGGAGGEGGEEGVGAVGVPAFAGGFGAGLLQPGLQVGVEDRFHAGERGGGEPAVDLDVAVGALPDAQPTGLVQPALSRRFILRGARRPAGLVGRRAGLTQIMAGLGPIQQALFAVRVGLGRTRHRVGFVFGDLAGFERGLRRRAPLEPSGGLQRSGRFGLGAAVQRGQPVRPRMGPGGIRVALLGPAGQQQLSRLEPADHHRQPLHP